MAKWIKSINIAALTSCYINLVTKETVLKIIDKKIILEMCKKCFYSLYFLIMLNAHVFGQGILFSHNSWPKVLAEAKEKNKFIFIDCYTDWCGPCKYLEQNVFTKKAIGDFMNQHYISLKMDMEKGVGMSFAEKFKVIGFPTFLVFNPEGRLIYKSINIENSESTTVWVRTFNDILNLKNFAKGLSEEIGMHYPKFYSDYYENRIKPKDSVLNKFISQNTNLSDEITWAVISTFADPSYYTAIISRNVSLLDSLYHPEINSLLGLIFDKNFSKVVKNKNEKEFYDLLKIKMVSLTDSAEKKKLNEKLEAELFFYAHTALNWRKFDSLVEDYRRLNPANHLAFYCLWAFNHCSDTCTLKKMACWMNLDKGKGRNDVNYYFSLYHSLYNSNQKKEAFLQIDHINKSKRASNYSDNQFINFMVYRLLEAGSCYNDLYLKSTLTLYKQVVKPKEFLDELFKAAYFLGANNIKEVLRILKDLKNTNSSKSNDISKQIVELMIERSIDSKSLNAAKLLVRQ